MVCRTSKLQGLITDAKTLYKRLTHLKSDVHGQPKFHRTGFLGLYGEKVNLVDHYENGFLGDLEQNVKTEQSDISVEREAQGLAIGADRDNRPNKSAIMKIKTEKGLTLDKSVKKKRAGHELKKTLAGVIQKPMMLEQSITDREVVKRIGESLIKKDREDERDPGMEDFFSRLPTAYRDPCLMPLQFSENGNGQTTPLLA